MMENNAVQPNKERIHNIRCELQKYGFVRNEVDLSTFLTFFKNLLDDILKKTIVQIDEQYITVTGIFEGTEMTWRTKKT